MIRLSLRAWVALSVMALSGCTSTPGVVRGACEVLDAIRQQKGNAHLEAAHAKLQLGDILGAHMELQAYVTAVGADEEVEALSALLESQLHKFLDPKPGP